MIVLPFVLGYFGGRALNSSANSVKEYFENEIQDVKENVVKRSVIIAVVIGATVYYLTKGK